MAVEKSGRSALFTLYINKKRNWPWEWDLNSPSHGGTIKKKE